MRRRKSRVEDRAVGETLVHQHAAVGCMDLFLIKMQRNDSYFEWNGNTVHV